MAHEAQAISAAAPALPFQTMRAHRGLWSDAWRRLVRNRLAALALVMLIAIALLAYVGSNVGVTGRYQASEQDHSPEAKQTGPTWDHWFGTDQLGRDTFARVLAGTRISLQIGLGTQVVVLITGLAIGALAAFGGKFLDNVVMRFTDVMFAFPDLLFIILIRAILAERDIPIITNPILIMILAIAMIQWTTIARLVRGQMLSLQERDFVLAARALGAPRWRIVFQHMLPNTLGPVIVAVTFGIPIAIFAEAALSFVGLGVQGTTSLGTLVQLGYAVIQRNVWNVVFPAGSIAVLMLCFTFLGDGLRDALDPRTRSA
jgi:oligopeptide transport system permease protein